MNKLTYVGMIVFSCCAYVASLHAERVFDPIRDPPAVYVPGMEIDYSEVGNRSNDNNAGSQTDDKDNDRDRDRDQE